MDFHLFSFNLSTTTFNEWPIPWIPLLGPWLSSGSLVILSISLSSFNWKEWKILGRQYMREYLRSPKFSMVWVIHHCSASIKSKKVKTSLNHSWNTLCARKNLKSYIYFNKYMMTCMPFFNMVVQLVFHGVGHLSLQCFIFIVKRWKSVWILPETPQVSEKNSEIINLFSQVYDILEAFLGHGCPWFSMVLVICHCSALYL